MKKTIIILPIVAIIIVGVYLVLVNDRYEFNADNLTKIDKWTGDVLVYDKNHDVWESSKKSIDVDAYFKEQGILIKEDSVKFDRLKEDLAARYPERKWTNSSLPSSAKAYQIIGKLSQNKLMEMEPWDVISTDARFENLPDDEKKKIQAQWVADAQEVLKTSSLSEMIAGLQYVRSLGQSNEWSPPEILEAQAKALEETASILKKRAKFFRDSK